MKTKFDDLVYTVRAFCLVCSLSLLCLACTQPAGTLSTEETPSLEGVWKLTGHFVLDLEGDTAYVYPEVVEHKIYKDGHVMWCASPVDSTEWYGFGRAAAHRLRERRGQVAREQGGDTDA